MAPFGGLLLSPAREHQDSSDRTERRSIFAKMVYLNSQFDRSGALCLQTHNSQPNRECVCPTQQKLTVSRGMREITLLAREEVSAELGNIGH
eukprot:gene4364-biopygen12559